MSTLVLPMPGNMAQAPPWSNKVTSMDVDDLVADMPAPRAAQLAPSLPPGDVGAEFLPDGP